MSLPVVIDWDETVREAFVHRCMANGVEASVARRALLRSRNSHARTALIAQVRDSSRRASTGWQTIDGSLARWGELAALAFERCVEETSLEIKCSEPEYPSDDAQRIVARAKARLDRFWRGTRRAA